MAGGRPRCGFIGISTFVCGFSSVYHFLADDRSDSFGGRLVIIKELRQLLPSFFRFILCMVMDGYGYSLGDGGGIG